MNPSEETLMASNPHECDEPHSTSLFLEMLPMELHGEIAGWCDAPSHLALAFTCTKLFCFIPCNGYAAADWCLDALECEHDELATWIYESAHLRFVRTTSRKPQVIVNRRNVIPFENQRHKVYYRLLSVINRKSFIDPSLCDPTAAPTFADVTNLLRQQELPLCQLLNAALYYRCGLALMFVHYERHLLQANREKNYFCCCPRNWNPLDYFMAVNVLPSNHDLDFTQYSWPLVKRMVYAGNVRFDDLLRFGPHPCRTISNLAVASNLDVFDYMISLLSNESILLSLIDELPYKQDPAGTVAKLKCIFALEHHLGLIYGGYFPHRALRHVLSTTSGILYRLFLKMLRAVYGSTAEGIVTYCISDSACVNDFCIIARKLNLSISETQKDCLKRAFSFVSPLNALWLIEVHQFNAKWYRIRGTFFERKFFYAMERLIHMGATFDASAYVKCIEKFGVDSGCCDWLWSTAHDAEGFAAAFLQE